MVVVVMVETGRKEEFLQRIIVIASCGDASQPEMGPFFGQRLGKQQRYHSKQAGGLCCQGRGKKDRDKPRGHVSSVTE